MKWSSILVVALVLFSWVNAYAQPLEPASFPSLISSLKTTTTLDFCGEPVPVDNQEIRERLEKELLLSLWDRPQVVLWLKRSRRYLPIIEKMLQDKMMPDDLKYIAIAESALRPHVRSKMGAIGFWQFIKDTGGKYGLEINKRIDERRNIFTSTRAALLFLDNLHRAFGSWTLAAAAFNMGEEGLTAEILEQGTRSYYQLYLPLETQRYVFRILCAKVIMSDPKRYGFQLSDNDYYPPQEFDRIQVHCSHDIPLRILAEAAQTHFKAIKDLNPEIRGHYLPQGKRVILIPKGTAKGFQARYQPLVKNWLRDRKERVYIVKKGDNLSIIADQFNVPLAALIIWNRLDLRAPIHPGDELVIYQNQRKDFEIVNHQNAGEIGTSENE